MNSSAMTDVKINPPTMQSALCTPLPQPRRLCTKYPAVRGKASARHSMAVAAASQQERISLSSLRPGDPARANDLKVQIAEQAGSKNGTDLSPDQKAKVEQSIKFLEALNPTKQLAYVDLKGSLWKLIYTTSTAASSGKIGPFVGYVEQEFPADRKGIYINWVSFLGGLLKAKLVAEYESLSGRGDKLDVRFIDTTFSLGPLKYTKEFDANRGGWWRLSYVDADYRILYANTGNVFVLAKVKE